MHLEEAAWEGCGAGDAAVVCVSGAWLRSQAGSSLPWSPFAAREGVKVAKSCEVPGSDGKVEQSCPAPGCEASASCFSGSQDVLE